MGYLTNLIIQFRRLMPLINKIRRRMESKKLIGKNIAKIIKSIWLNNIMPVSKNTNIVIPKLKNKRKNTIPKRFTTCGIVRLLLSLSSISVFTTSSLVFPSSSSGLADTRASTRPVDRHVHGIFQLLLCSVEAICPVG